MIFFLLSLLSMSNIPNDQVFVWNYNHGLPLNSTDLHPPDEHPSTPRKYQIVSKTLSWFPLHLKFKCWTIEKYDYLSQLQCWTLAENIGLTSLCSSPGYKAGNLWRLFQNIFRIQSQPQHETYYKHLLVAKWR